MRPLACLLALALAACDSTPGGEGARYVGRADGRVDRYAGGGEAAVLPSSDGPVTALAVLGRRVYTLVDAPDAGRLAIADATGGQMQSVAVASPRALALAGGVAYVASRDSTALVPVYPASAQAGLSIRVRREPEGVVVVGQRAFVANTGSGYWLSVSVVDTETQTQTTHVDVCTAPRTLVADAEGDVWVVCTGRAGADGSVEASGAVAVLDGGSGAILALFPTAGLLGTRGQGADAAFARSAGELYVADGDGLLRFGTRANAPAGRLALADNAPLSVVAFDERADRLLLGRLDAPGSATGFVSVHDRTGAETERFGAGAAPTALATDEAE